MTNCFFCTNNIRKIDYKEADTLSKYVDAQGKIQKQRETHLCVKHQRKLARSIKRARIMSLMPFIKQ